MFNYFLEQASSDLSVLDFDIPLAISYVMASGTEMLVTIGIMASVTWQVLFVGILTMVCSKYVQVYIYIYTHHSNNEITSKWLVCLKKKKIISFPMKGYYQKSAGELMRINGTTKAPVMNYASETALGVTTIRAFRAVNDFSSNYLKLVNTDAKVFLSSNATLEWLVMRTEALQNLTLFTAAFFLIVAPKSYVAPGTSNFSIFLTTFSLTHFRN